MKKAKVGDTVTVNYTGKLRDGEVFDSSEGKDPIKFTLGKGQVIQGFDSGIVGMEEGEEKTIEIPAEFAYGEHKDELIVEVPREKLPEDFEPKKDERLTLNLTQGRQVPVRVHDFNDNTILFDANHDLAGKDLVFDVELVAIG
jgi:peptidylprolyl isomerase